MAGIFQLLFCLFLAVVIGNSHSMSAVKENSDDIYVSYPKTEQEQNEKLECYETVRRCAEDFHSSYYRRHYIEARDLMKTTEECLDKVTCDDDGYVEYLKQELHDTREEYASGILLGNCSYLNMEKCRLIPHNGAELAEELFQNYTQNMRRSVADDTPRYEEVPCPEENMDAARKCMAEIMPFCINQNQIELYNETLGLIHESVCHRLVPMDNETTEMLY